MNGKRLINIDILRALATLWVLTYHIWVYCQYPSLGYTSLIAYGGEIGVTLFFIISGFSIFLSLNKIEKIKKQIRYKDYLMARIKRILPGYLLCIFIIITFTGFSYSNVYTGIADIFVHLFFIHNFFVFSHGSINGVFWTLGVTVQFYLIAPLLYEWIKKNPFISWILSIFIVIIYKIVLYKIIGDNNFDSVYYFIYGKQLFGCLDSFVTGMILAYIYNYEINYQKFIEYNKFLLLIGLFGSIILVLSLNKSPLYSSSLFSILWHSSFTLCLLITLLGFIYLNINSNIFLIKLLLNLASIEYGIYLWHLPILIKFNDLIQAIPNTKFYLLGIVVLGWTIIVVKLFKNIENDINNKINNFFFREEKNIFIRLYGLKKYISYEFLYYILKKKRKLCYTNNQDKYVIIISHTNPYKSLGGVEKRILEEIEFYKNKGMNIIHISPLRLNAFSEIKRNLYSVIINAEHLGYFAIEEIVNFLKLHRIDSIHIHHLLFWTFKDYQMLIDFKQHNKVILHIHDFYYLFPEKYVEEFKNIIPLDKNNFIRNRNKVFERVDELIFPSLFTYNVYIKHYNITHIKKKLIPHLAFKNGKKEKRKLNSKIRLAFIGYKNKEKGFHLWESIINENYISKYDLYHFSNTSEYFNVKVINYSTSRDGIDILTKKLIYYNIDYVLLLSTIPETFSYVLYECIAAGIKIFCLKGSGNIETFVKDNKCGIVFNNIDQLKEYLENEDTIKNQCTIERLTYDLIVNYDSLATLE